MSHNNKNFVKELITCIAAAALFFLPSCDYIATPGNNAEDIFSNTKESIVRIHTMTEEGLAAKSGTGFCLKVGDQLEIITNRHITENQSILIIESEHGSWIQTDWKEHKNLDLSRLPLPTNAELKPINIASKKSIRQGAKIFTIGHPLGYSIAVYEGMINSINKGKIIFSAPLSEGASGSPLLNLNGDVVGVCDSYMANAQNYNLATPIMTIVREEEWVAKKVTVDKALDAYIKSISEIRQKIRKNEKVWATMAEQSDEIKNWVDKTGWTRILLNETAENACISFAAIEWGDIKNTESLRDRKKEAILLKASGQSFRQAWEEHKKVIEENKTDYLSGYFFGMKETEEFVQSTEEIASRLIEYLNNQEQNKKTSKYSKTQNKEANDLKKIIEGLGKYQTAQTAYFKVGSP